MAKKPIAIIPKSIVIEGNNGGSYISIEETEKPEIIRLTVGHDCVHTFRDVEIGVFALCAILSQAWDKPGFAAMFNEHYAGSPPSWGGPIPDKATQKRR